jgi:3'-phosphoadenosine 5'-phosphosulfate sulfotransferase (PAPS reductase)/FAD synthetase
MEFGDAREVIHIDTGIGVPEGKEFVIELCKAKGWPLKIYQPPTKQYEDLVMQYGFPGPALHYIMYNWLKERAVRQVVRETKLTRLEEVGLLTGVHNAESVRRMGFTRPLTKVGSQVWLAQLFDWIEPDFTDYKRSYSLPTSPVKQKLGFSGECLCGSFAQPREIERIDQHYPVVADRLHQLAKRAKALHKWHIWGQRPQSLDQYELAFMPMCSGCPARLPTSTPDVR